VSALIPVLLYHSVSDDSPPTWGAVPPALFAAHLDVIRASGRATTTITELADGLRGRGALPERPLAITFDDGYADTYEAVQLLSGHGLSATVYMTSGQVGMTGRLSGAQLSELSASGAVEVGSHGVTHRALDELSGDEVAAEVAASKAKLEQLIPKRVDSFSYPHGAHDRAVRAAVIAAGYRSAAAVKNAVSHRRDDPFAIARLTVTANTTPARLAEALEGRSVPVAWRRDRLRTRAYRTLRSHRRRLLRAHARD
jgi:peptidoglycan/xylan/chitin deacetylase (PgdA/CDA1 family)